MKSFFRKPLGISLLEQLLAISVIALVVILGVQRYNLFEQQQDIHRIQTDIGNLFMALDEYFYGLGCKTDGTFSGHLNSDITSQLNITHLYSNSSHFIQHFSAEIIQINNIKHLQKPRYQFIISAHTKSLPPEKLAMLANRTDSFHADYENQLIKWKSLPMAEYLHPKAHPLLMGRLRHFKNQLNMSEDTNYVNCAQ